MDEKVDCQLKIAKDAPFPTTVSVDSFLFRYDLYFLMSFRKAFNSLFTKILNKMFVVCGKVSEAQRIASQVKNGYTPY